MKRLTTQGARSYLGQIGMGIGAWNQIVGIGEQPGARNNWINYQAPEDAHQLLNFSQHVAGWLPQGTWKILQLDNSNAFDPVQSFLFERCLSGGEENLDLATQRSFLFEFGPDKRSNASSELLISQLIFMLLLFEGHGHIVSSGCTSKRLAIQDGFVYFVSDTESDRANAESLLEDFESDPLMAPRWITEIIVERQ